MDESEINKLIKSMIKKFQYGGKESGRKLGNPSDFEYKSQSTAVPASIVGAPKVYGEIKDYRFVNDTIPNGDMRNRYAKSIIQQYFMPHGTVDGKYEDT